MACRRGSGDGGKKMGLRDVHKIETAGLSK